MSDFKNRSVGEETIQINISVPREWFCYAEGILEEKHGINIEKLDDAIIQKWISYLVGYSGDKEKVDDLLDIIKEHQEENNV